MGGLGRFTCSHCSTGWRLAVEAVCHGGISRHILPLTGSRCHLCFTLLPLQVGLVRDLQFITPVKAKIGPPQAMCHQTQRLQVRG